MKTSEKCIQAIKIFEGGPLLAPYKCPAGVLTIGYGHTAGVTKSMRINPKRAEELLQEDVRAVEHEINLLGLTLTQGQFDALVDFTFNLGIGKLRQSTLLRKIRSGAPDTAVQTEFKRWVYAGGKLLPGLVKRRAWEALRWIES